MHIAIPFDIETVRQSWGQPGRMWGRVVANHDFLKALARAPACTRLTLFVPGRQDVELLGRTLVASFGPAQAKVAVVPLARLPAHLEAAPVDVMHVLDPQMWWAGHVRGQLSRQGFVVTGVTHSLANQHFLEWALLNSANGIGADDCLVCTTPTARAVVESAFTRLRAGQPDFRAPATTVIPLGASVQVPAGSRADSRSRLGLDADTFVVLSLARFNPQFKMDMWPLLNLATLLTAKAGGAVKFILAGSAGDGDYVRFMREQVREAGLEGRLEFVLDPDEARKAQLLRAADVFLSLSDNLQETFGLTVVEAMAAGLPVVASDWNGYRSLIEDGVSGFLVPTMSLAPDAAWEATLALRYDSLVHLFSAQTTAVDLDVACEHLVRLAGDRPLRERMAAAAVIRAGLFDWDVVIGRYLELWERLRTSRAPGDPARSSALHFAGDFAGYASARLGPDDRFRTTESGKAVLKGKRAPRLYFETDEFLDVNIMTRILERCADGRSLGQLLPVLPGEAAGGGTLRISQNVLWLYKYGYLRLL